MKYPPTPPCLPGWRNHRWVDREGISLRPPDRPGTLVIDTCARCGVERHETAMLEAEDGRNYMSMEYVKKGA